jgi:N-acetyl-S-(2-succino)cysteine monooxygenase
MAVQRSLRRLHCDVPVLAGWALRFFVEHVIPELQRRGLFRGGYEGTALCEHLGLLRPQNRFFLD